MNTQRDWQHLGLQRQERVLEVEIRGSGKVNALSQALMRELLELALALHDDTTLNAVILHGSERAFSGGIDLADPALGEAGTLGLAEQRKLAQLGPRMCAAWEQVEALTIVAIEGCCVGGGMALASACDWRVAARDAVLLVPELRLGMNMSWQSVPRFVNLVGPARTKQLLLLDGPLPVATALDWGLVDRACEPREALSVARTLAATIAALPPVALRMCKQAVNQAAGALNNATSYMDADQLLLTQTGADAAEGVRAFFEKRPPRFEGR